MQVRIGGRDQAVREKREIAERMGEKGSGGKSAKKKKQSFPRS